MGIVCPMAHDVETFWQGLLSGKNGMAKTTIFDASTFPTTFSAEVKNYNLAEHTKNHELHRYSNRGSAFVVGAAAQACRQAKIDIETDSPADGIDRRRVGIYLGAGEGSVDNDAFFAAIAEILIIESLDSAKKRGVDILAEVTGYGSSSDAFRVTDMHEDARGAIQAIEAALADAGITYKDIDHINTHGTSTVENDSVETKAVKAVFKDQAYDTPLTSVKSMMGHLIGATGAAEMITCVLAIRDNIIPPTMNLNDPDPELDLDYVPNVPRETPVNIALNESFGFGGQNNVVILKRYQD